MRRKIIVFALCPLLFVLSISAEAQEPKKIPMIGLLSARVKPSPASPDAGEVAFRQGLRDFGYTEGKNVLIVYRYGEGKADRLPELASELIQLKVDVIVSAATGGISAAKQATKTIPIVMMIRVDPVAAGFVESLARPGGNITGVARLRQDLSGKRLEVLKEAVPKLSRVGVLDSEGGHNRDFKFYEAAARAMKIQILSLTVSPAEPNFQLAFDGKGKSGRPDHC